MPELRLVEVGLMDGRIVKVGIDAKKPVWEQMPEDWLMFTVLENWGSYRVVRDLTPKGGAGSGAKLAAEEAIPGKLWFPHIGAQAAN